jgi:hypothetical protein
MARQGIEILRKHHGEIYRWMERAFLELGVPPTHVTYRAEYVPAPRFCWCHAQLQSYLTRRCLASKRSQLWHRDDYTHRLGPRLSIAYPVAKNLRERAVHCSIRIPKQPKTDLIDPSHINRTRKFAVASFLVPSILNAIWI